MSRPHMPLIRYLVSGYVRSGGGVAPIVLILFIFLLVLQAHLFTVDVFQGISILLLPLAAWITFVMLDSETRTQEEITAVTAHGLPRLRLIKTVMAWAINLALVALVFAPTVIMLFAAPTAWALLALAAAFTATGCVLAALLHATVGRQVIWRILIAAVVTVMLIQTGRHSPWVSLIHDAPAGQPWEILRDGALVAALCGVVLLTAVRVWRHRGV